MGLSLRTFSSLTNWDSGTIHHIVGAVCPAGGLNPTVLWKETEHAQQLG